MKKFLVVFAALIVCVIAGLLVYYFVFADRDGASSSSASQESPSVEGTVLDAAMNTLTVELANGAQYIFSTEGAEIDAGEKGLAIGDTVKIFYTGSLVEGQEQQTVTVTKVVDVAGQNVGDPIVTGVVTDAYQQTIQIQLEDGTEYRFPFEDAVVETDDVGIFIGDTVEIHYEGQLVADQLDQSVTVTKIIVLQHPDTQGADGESIAGTVTDATMNTITIDIGDGTLYTFSTEGASIAAGENGILIGDEVIIVYTGSIMEGQQVQDVSVSTVIVTGAQSGEPEPFSA